MRTYEYKGYLIVRGRYTGTPDDRRDRWYVDGPRSTTVDPLRRGFARVAWAKLAIYELKFSKAEREERARRRAEAYARAQAEAESPVRTPSQRTLRSDPLGTEGRSAAEPPADRGGPCG